MRVCKMNFSYKSSFILLSCILTLAICGSHFELIKNSEKKTGEQGTGPFLHKTFFQCDRQPTCTHVIQIDGSDEFSIVHGDDALLKMTNIRNIWRKMGINAVHGMYE